MNLILSHVCGRNQRQSLDVPASMRRETVTIPAGNGIDWKGLGYLISIGSVFFLGGVAWPKPDAPWWHLPALILGMASSIIGMGCRYKAHLDEQHEIKKVQAEAKSKRR
jgi:hypothetical protein